MAPFRNRDRSNRSGRGQVEHNVLEGLPINQYREVEVTIGNNSTENRQIDKDAWPGPPMPRDSHLLPEHSQQILKAARAARIYKPPAPPEEDIENGDEEHEHKEVPQGFAVKKWVKVARHLEEPEPEYLAKRRKGLPSQYAVGEVAMHVPAMRETKVKKTDAEGNVVVYKALVPEGQALEGEIQEADVVVEAAPVVAVPGTVVEGVGVVNAEGVVVANDIMQQTPPRRRPPPPKKKRKSGPGRGKKKVVFVEGAPEQGKPASGTGSDFLAVPGANQEGSVEPSEGGDTPMPDAGDDEEGSGEEGSDDDEHEEGTHSPTPAEDSVPKPSAGPTSAPVDAPPIEPLAEDAPMADASSTVAPKKSSTPSTPKSEQSKPPQPTRDPSSSPEMPLSAISHSRQNSANQVPTLASLDNTATPVSVDAPAPTVEPVVDAPAPAPQPVTEASPEAPSANPQAADDSEPDLLASLESQLDKDSASMAAS
ncbi:hypothetical protein CC80DRAFT_441582 [Byssothecium circinans]|uniref:Uncharacterized protein n=1 Tax=Byssothecium circinans TaxID=147558 RepID=A0A6A5U4G9_9PLEO|nr:hypothetical protein CC80DRAFT_441582 [Byssothecium circinans]